MDKLSLLPSFHRVIMNTVLHNTCYSSVHFMHLPICCGVATKGHSTNLKKTYKKPHYKSKEPAKSLLIYQSEELAVRIQGKRISERGVCHDKRDKDKDLLLHYSSHFYLEKACKF